MLSQRSEVRGQRSEVRGQRAEGRGRGRGLSRGRAGQGRAGQGSAVQKAECKWQETGAQGRKQWSQGKGAQSESEVRQRSEVRGQAECRGTGIDISRGRDRDRRQGIYPPVSLEERP